jgi:hypothetical protein
MEPKDDCNAMCDYIPDEIAFTRYLYPKVFVKQSIMLALLEHNYDETMFWTYELYFSGFEDETYDFIFKLYHDIYRYDNPKLIKFMETTRDVWYNNSLQYWLIGSIVATLCYCNFRLDKFVENYFKVHCSHIEQHSKKLVIIQLREQDIREYKINRHVDPPRNYLGLVCKYPIRNNMNRLFMSDIPDLQKKWYYNWEFYAGQSPLWQERFDDFHARISMRDQKVIFEDEDWKEAFYERWNLEPDEQSLEIQHIILGNKEEKQLSLKEFCQKYGCPLLTKLIRRP